MLTRRGTSPDAPRAGRHRAAVAGPRLRPTPGPPIAFLAHSRRWNVDNMEIVREITDAFAENRMDDRVLSRYFASDFEHVVNGRRSDLRGYSDRLSRYMQDYERFRITDLDEPFAADDKVVTSYTLEGKKRSGETEEL